MSDTTSRGDDDVLGGGFDQTNDTVGGLEGESDGTADGETRSDAAQEDGTLAGGGVLDDLHDGLGDPYVGDTERMGSTAAGEDRGTGA
jgi:hypothetical protein